MKSFLTVVAVLAISLMGWTLVERGGHPPTVERPEAGVTWPLETVGVSPDSTIQTFTAWIEGVKNAEEQERLAALARLEAARAAAIPTSASPGNREAPPVAGCGVADLIRAAWADTPDAEWAVAVAIRESHCDPAARNPSGASGIFQLMMPLHYRLVAGVCGEPADQLVFDAACNIAAARVLYAGSGRAPWNL